VGGVETQVYNYTIEQENSTWRVALEGHEIFPGYEGSIWIDPEAKRVLRIEMIATTIPSDYPLDMLEMAVDYGPEEINGKQYYLAQNSRNITCKRYSRNCSQNQITFRNYRKFSAESTIMATDSSVTYGEGGQEGPQLAEPPQVEETKEP
jgi:hypothetical protein